MNYFEQGALRQGKLTSLLIHILLLSTFLLTNVTYAGTLPHEKSSEKHHVSVIYSADNKLHSNIVQKLSDTLTLKNSDIIISKVTPEETIIQIDNNADIIIGIGAEGMRSANKYYPTTNKLFISTDPEKFSLDSDVNKNDAILYMTQSYCRQMQFIKLIRDDWKVVSLLSSEEKPANSTIIEQCANKYGLEIYTVNTTAKENMTENIKNALNHSDALLALPDKSIYNSNSVKNILLTSYRHRKPVIAFSHNFVSAGALASIHSNIEQVAQSASSLIQQYFETGQHFIKTVNYPQTFDISINRQVFRALNLTTPDIDKLRQILEQTEAGESEVPE